MSLAEFFHMGGYAFYVWVSYGLALLILVANIVVARRRQRELLRTLARRQRRAETLQRKTVT